jgi:nicotinate dehydrogenase subunit B
MSARARAAHAASMICVLFGCGSSGSASDAGTFDGSPTSERGYAAVQARGCGECHQSPDPRDGVLSGQTTPRPGTRSYGSNLTPDPDTGMDAWDAGSIAAAVLYGADDQGALLCPPMPAFVEAGMAPDEALSIAAYLQSLTPVWHLVPASECVRPPMEPMEAGR